jgi:hypothetical protein
MTDSNVINLNKPEQNDPLQEVLRENYWLPPLKPRSPPFSRSIAA